MAVRLVFVLALAALPGICADAPVQPLGVCEVLGKSEVVDGQVIAIVGRYSFREDGRYMSEDGCEEKSTAARKLGIRFGSAPDAPTVPAVLEFDGALLRKKLSEIKLRTALKKFRFGELDYDRWAVVYGRIEFPKSTRKTGKDAGARPPMQLVCHGDNAILFLREE